jgi:hypothetical protein
VRGGQHAPDDAESDDERRHDRERGEKHCAALADPGLGVREPACGGDEQRAEHERSE